MMDDEAPGAYIGKLNEYCQKHRLELEYRELLKTGPPHDSRFTVQAIVGKKEFPEAEGRSKKEARNAAAKIAVQILNKQSKTETVAFPETDDSFEVIFFENYVGHMNRISQKNKVPVDYDFIDRKDSEPNRFYCQCKVNRETYGTGAGPTKQDAKQRAAEMAYNRIQSEEASQKAKLMSSGSVTSRNGSLSSSAASSSESSLAETTSGSRSGYSESTGSYASWPSSKLNQKRPPSRLAPSFKPPGAPENESTMNDRFLNDFKDIAPIASGGFGQVFRAQHRIDRKIYAIKRVKYDRSKVEREVKALADFNHPNIVHYYDCWSGRDYYEDSMKDSRILTECLFIKMEYCDKGTLDNWIFKRDKPQKELALEFFRQITEGVSYIHQKDFIHRDLKPSNIFLVDEKLIKIGDFGLVTTVKTDSKLTANLGTPQYMSPEQNSMLNYDNKVDIFALGLILAELLHMCKTTTETIKLFNKLRAGDFGDEFNHNEKSLLRRLLATEAKNRPTALATLETLKLWKDAAQTRRWHSH